MFAPGLKGLLKRACAIGRRRDALADSTLKIYETDLTRRLDRLMSLIPTHKAGGKLQKIIKKVRRHLFVFVTNRDLTATNNGSEMALRPLRGLPQNHQRLSQRMGRRALRRYPIRRRNRTAKIDPSHRRHPPHPRRPPPSLRSLKT